MHHHVSRRCSSPCRGTHFFLLFYSKLYTNTQTQLHTYVCIYGHVYSQSNIIYEGQAGGNWRGRQWRLDPAVRFRFVYFFLSFFSSPLCSGVRLVLSVPSCKGRLRPQRPHSAIVLRVFSTPIFPFSPAEGALVQNIQRAPPARPSAPLQVECACQFYFSP